MIIYVWPNGEWCYEWDWCLEDEDWATSRMINLDRLYEYKDLTKEEIKACEDALSD